MLKSSLIGAVSGAAAFGVGEIASALFTDICASTTTLTAAQVNLIVAAPQAIFHGFSQGFITGISGGDIGQGIVSSMVSSVISSVSGIINSSIGLKGTAGDISTMLFGSGSGGLTAELTGGNFWQGAATGLTVSALNHVTHRMVTPISKLQGDPEPWDLNGDGILQKDEADLWGVKQGTDITVDNSKIDWSGLKIPEGYNDLDIFSIETHEAFLKLPWETAATYGGTSFKVISVEKGIVEVQDQSYHYNMRPNNSVKNILRNIATEIGYPSTMELYHSRFQPYLIHYKNPTIKLK